MGRSTSMIATCSVLIALCIIFFSGIATASTSVSIVPSSQTIVPGEDFTLVIHVKPDTSIAGIQLDLSYDSTLVDINNIEEGNFFVNSGSAVMFNPGTIDKDEGTISMIYSSIIMGDPVSDEGVFCTLDLTAGYDHGPCEFRITDIVLGDKDGNELPVVTLDSLINVAETSGNTDKSNSDDEDTELNILQTQDEEAATSQDSEQSIPDNENEEQAFASTDDTAATNEMGEDQGTEVTSTGTSGVIILVLAAIAFFAVAYFLDRKNKQ